MHNGWNGGKIHQMLMGAKHPVNSKRKSKKVKKIQIFLGI
jgi:hypothetical protein